MEATREVLASLEGQRVRVEAGAFYFEDYNFRYDQWELKENAPSSLDRETAAAWLAGWNRVDRNAAFNLLVEPHPYRGFPPSDDPTKIVHKSVILEHF